MTKTKTKTKTRKTFHFSDVQQLGGDADHSSGPFRYRRKRVQKLHPIFEDGMPAFDDGGALVGDWEDVDMQSDAWPKEGWVQI